MHRTWSFIAIIALLISWPTLVIPSSLDRLHPRTTDPYFPDTPPSCPICAVGYPNISSCAAACYLFQNFTEIIFNPSGFVDVIKCSCTDTFSSVFPQCVDCFIQTNQTDVLQSDNLPSVVSGMRQVCAFASALFGGVASADGEVPPSTTVASATAASATSTSNLTSSGQLRVIFGHEFSWLRLAVGPAIIVGVMSGILSLL